MKKPVEKPQDAKKHRQSMMISPMIWLMVSLKNKKNFSPLFTEKINEIIIQFPNQFGLGNKFAYSPA
jgi:hypothetical protein